MRRWLFRGIVLLCIAELLPGFVLENYATGLIFLCFLGLVNYFVRPLLIFLTIPVTIFTLGLFLLVINTWMFSWVTGWVDGISVDGFGTAFLSALILTISTYLLEREKKQKVPAAKVEKE